MEKQQRMGKGTIIFLAIFGAITVAAFVFSGHIYGVNSVFYQNITQNVFINTLYQKIPALINTVQIITVAYLLNLCFRFLFHCFGVCL